MKLLIDVEKYFPKERIYIRTKNIKSTKIIRVPNQSEVNLKKEVIAFRIDKFGKFLYLPLKFEPDKEWFYISELLRTDGHISKDLVEIKLTNTSKILKRKFIDFCKRLKITYIREEYDRIRIFNKTLAYILVKIFGIQSGNKTFTVFMPKWMKKSKRKLLASALQGAFDGDGCVQLTLSKNKRSGPTRRIRLYGASTKYLQDVQELLSRFDIASEIFKDPRPNKTYFLQITKRNSILNFYNKIGFLHKKRKQKLQKVANSYGNYYFLDEFENKIKRLLFLSSPLTITNIANKLNRKISTVSEQITKLEKRGLIKIVKSRTKKLVYPN